MACRGIVREPTSSGWTILQWFTMLSGYLYASTRSSENRDVDLTDAALVSTVDLRRRQLDGQRLNVRPTSSPENLSGLWPRIHVEPVRPCLPFQPAVC